MSLSTVLVEKRFVEVTWLSLKDVVGELGRIAVREN